MEIEKQEHNIRTAVKINRRPVKAFFPERKNKIIRGKMSIKDDLIGEQFVKGNSRNILQSYQIFYYHPEVNFPTSKVWIYLKGTENKQPRTIRSLCFENIENHKRFILNNIIYNLYLTEKRCEDYLLSTVPISVYRIKFLDSLLNDLRKKIMERWKEKELKVRV